MHKLLGRLQRDLIDQSPPSLVIVPGRPRPWTMAALARVAAPLCATLPVHGDPALVLALLLAAHDHVKTVASKLARRHDAEAGYIRGLAHRRQMAFADACCCYHQVQDVPMLAVMASVMEHQNDVQARQVLERFPHLVDRGRFRPAIMCGIVQQVCQGGHPDLITAVERVQAIELGVVLRWSAGWGRRLATSLGCAAPI